MFSHFSIPYTLRITGDNPESGSEDLKPDLCLYRVDASRGGSHPYDLDQSTSSDDAKPHHGRTAWAWIVVPVEVKTSPAWAPFIRNQDSDGWVCHSDKYGSRARAPMAGYVSEINVRQHRQFIFTVHIQEELVFFHRWDRAGALVSEPVNIREDLETVLEFFHRIALGTLEQQGYDTSFTLEEHPADSTEGFQEFRRHVEQDPELKEIAKEYYMKYIDAIISNHPMIDPIYKVCPSRNGLMISYPL